MQVILLAAGQSTRLDPIADKNTLEFAGKSLIEHQISVIKQAKLRDIAVVANKFNIEKITEVLEKYKNVDIVEQKNLEAGMAGGVLAGAEAVKHKSILVMSTNDVFDKSLLDNIVQASKNKDTDGVIACKKMEQYFPGGYLKIEKNSMITDIVEKPAKGKEPSKFVNLVCHVYNDFPKFIHYLKKSNAKVDNRYEDAINQYIKKGKANMLTLKYNGPWHAIKYPWDIFGMMNHYLTGQEPKIDRSAKIAKTAVIEGNVVIGPNAKVFDYAVIKGPAYIGENSIVATNALVRESMIGRNCVIGFATEITRSYLNHDVWCHSNYIGDSIIDYNVSFGSGTVLGNLRFDEENVKINIKKDKINTGKKKFGAIIGNGVRTGVNSCTNPGRKIGWNTFIGGGVLVDEDIENNKIVLLEQKLKVTKNKVTVNTEARSDMKNKLRK